MNAPFKARVIKRNGVWLVDDHDPDTLIMCGADDAGYQLAWRVAYDCTKAGRPQPDIYGRWPRSEMGEAS